MKSRQTFIPGNRPVIYDRSPVRSIATVCAERQHIVAKNNADRREASKTVERQRRETLGALTRILNAPRVNREHVVKLGRVCAHSVTK